MSQRLREVALVFFKLGCFAFGGPWWVLGIRWGKVVGGKAGGDEHGLCSRANGECGDDRAGDSLVVEVGREDVEDSVGDEDMDYKVPEDGADIGVGEGGEVE